MHEACIPTLQTTLYLITLISQVIQEFLAPRVVPPRVSLKILSPELVGLQVSLTYSGGGIAQLSVPKIWYQTSSA